MENGEWPRPVISTRSRGTGRGFRLGPIGTNWDQWRKGGDTLERPARADDLAVAENAGIRRIPPAGNVTRWNP